MARRHCSYCYGTGHNRRTCPSLKEHVEKNPDSWYARREKARKAEEKETPRKCSYCHGTGHNRRSCTDIKQHQRKFVEFERKYRAKVHEYLVNNQIGPGALVRMTEEQKSEEYAYYRNEIGNLERIYDAKPGKPDFLGVVLDVKHSDIKRVGNSPGPIQIQWLNIYSRKGEQKTTYYSLPEKALFGVTDSGSKGFYGTSVPFFPFEVVSPADPFYVEKDDTYVRKAVDPQYMKEQFEDTRNLHWEHHFRDRDYY